MKKNIYRVSILIPEVITVSATSINEACSIAKAEKSENGSNIQIVAIENTGQTIDTDKIIKL